MRGRQACSPLIQLFFGFASDIDQTNINRDIRDGNWLSSAWTCLGHLVLLKNVTVMYNFQCGQTMRYFCSSLECDNAHRASYFCPDVDNARYCYFHQMGILLKVISRMWSLHNIDELKKCQSRPLLVLKKLNLKEHVEIWNS